MSRKRIQEGGPSFEIGERVAVVPDSPLARDIARIIAAAKQRAAQAASRPPSHSSPESKAGGSN